jgi:hypothetical protein
MLPPLMLPSALAAAAAAARSLTCNHHTTQLITNLSKHLFLLPLLLASSRQSMLCLVQLTGAGCTPSVLQVSLKNMYSALPSVPG